MNADELQAIVEKVRSSRSGKKHRVAVCAAAGCLSSGGEAALAAFKAAIAEAGLADQVELFGTGCLGLCHAGPLVQVESGGDGCGEPGRICRCMYQKVDPAAAVEIVREHMAKGKPVDALRIPEDDPFFKEQTKIVLGNSGRIDPGVNLIIATGQNNLAMNKTVAQIARHFIDGKKEITEGRLNRVEAGIRAYDPCLSCSTHAMGRMPLTVRLVGPGGEVLAERSRW